MPQTHTVQQGDHLTSIAARYGFYNRNIIWDHPANAELKENRNPNILLPGDQLFIPDKTAKTECRPTTLLHTFYVDDQPLQLLITLKDWDGIPVANAACDLQVDAAHFPLNSDAAGNLSKSITKKAAQGAVRIDSPQTLIQFQIGYLDPSSADSGWRARLANLGYSSKLAEQDEGRMRLAVEEFQCENGLPVTGLMDDATKAKLEAVHGC